MISIIAVVFVQQGLNMLTIQLEGQRVRLRYWWLGRHVLLFFLLGHLDRQLFLRDLALAQRMSWLRTIFDSLLIFPELESTTWVCLIRRCEWRLSDLSSLDHNLVGVPFLASEDAVTLDEVNLGTEEEVKCMYATALTMYCNWVVSSL